MSEIKQEILFPSSGLNSDNAYEYVPMGDSPYRLHIMVGEDGENGALVQFKGNKQIQYTKPLNLSNVYFTLGSYYNQLRREAYYFIFSQPFLWTDPEDPSAIPEYRYDNRLLRLVEDTETIEDVFYDIRNWFGLDPTKNLTDVKMLGSWLFFNPVTDQPKMIDVDMAYNYTNYEAFDDTDPSLALVLGDIRTWRGGLFVANTSITAGEDPSTVPAKWDRIGDAYQDESTLSVTEFDRAFFLLKIPPVDRLEVSYGSNAAVQFNNVRGKTLRFCHRYQYFDNTYSTCSAHSQLTLPINDELYNGEIDGNLTDNNYIKIEFSLYSAALVKNIEIFFQALGEDWKRAAIVNRQDTTLLDTVSHSIDFYNNESYPSIDQLLPYVPYDAVPRFAKSMEIINENVLTFNGCDEGFDNIPKDEIEVALTTDIEAITAPENQSALIRDNIASSDITTERENTTQYIEGLPAVWLYIRKIDVDSWNPLSLVTTNDYYEILFGRYHVVLKLTAAMIVSKQTLATAIAAAIRAAGWSSAVPYLEDSGEWNVRIESWNSYPPGITVSKFYSVSGEKTALTKFGGFKTGAYHPFCLFYYDEAMRRGDAQVTTDMRIYVPSVNDYSPPVTTTAHRFYIDWAVNHTPPSWAKYWRWGYAGNTRCSEFVQYIISSVADSDPAADDNDVVNTVKVSILPLQTIRTTTTSKWNCFPNSTIPLYQFNEGDRIRFITEETDITVTGTKLGTAIDGTFDYEIVKFDEANSMIYIRAEETDLTNIGINSLAEIYTPRKTNTELDYYEFGDIMPILTDEDNNLVHGTGVFGTQDQVLGASPLAAEGRFVNGDVYHILRTPSKPLCEFTAAEYIVSDFHESMSWSDFYDSQDWDRGKVGREIPIGEVDLNIIRYSNVYLQNTQVNGITTFEYNKLKELNDVYGHIVSAVEQGNTLKVYQEKKASSIGVGRTEYVNADESGQDVQVQNYVLGSVRYSHTGYSTVFPESIAKNNKFIYFFDIYNGVMCRDSVNGIFPISGRYADVGGDADYKMQKWFKDKSKSLLASGIDHVKVISVWDEEFKCLIVSFKDTVDEDNNSTIIFHEPSNRWITEAQFEYTPENGYNQILELTYSVVKGFENGIGYVFDNETRFATFNIGSGSGTSPNITIEAVEPEILVTVPAPTITIDTLLAADNLPILVTVPAPTIDVSFMSVSVDGMSWSAESFGTSNKEASVLSLTGTTSATITSIPSWIGVLNSVNNPIGVGDSFSSGDTFYLYPYSVNTGIERTSTFIITDTKGNTAEVTVSQSAFALNANVTVVIDDSDTSGMVLYEANGVATAGSQSVNLTFTPDNPNYSIGQEIVSFGYYIYRNSVLNGYGYLYGVVNQLENGKTVYLSSNAVVGENILVTFKIV